MKKFFQQMLLPLLGILAILLRVAIICAATWTPIEWVVYSVSFVGTILLALFVCLGDAKSVVEQVKQVFIFFIIVSFVLFFVFLFMATWFEMRLMLNILLCSLAGVCISETIISPPKQCQLVVYLMDAIFVLIALGMLSTYFAEGVLVGIMMFLMLLRLVHFLIIIAILLLLVYFFKWIWQQLK